MSELRIVQFIREMHPFGGSSGVAWHLKNQFDALGIDNQAIVWRKERRHFKSKLIEKFYLMVDIICSTAIMTFRLKWLPKNVVIINHNDALGGDIYVDHGLHKAVVRNNKAMIFRNPLHLFMLVREEIRHRFAMYRRIVCLSSISKCILLDNYRFVEDSNIDVIPNGVDLERFNVTGRPARVSGLRAIFVGHEFDRKGLVLVLKSLAMLPKDVTLTVVGGSRQDVSKYLSFADNLGVGDRVSFLGRRDDIPDLMRQSDFMIMPSKFEAWPLVSLESMACGLPVLMSNVGGALEMIHPYKTGFIINHNPESISSAIMALYDDRSLLEQMSIESAEFAKGYSWRCIAERYVDLARQVWASRT